MVCSRQSHAHTETPPAPCTPLGRTARAASNFDYERFNLTGVLVFYHKSGNYTIIRTATTFEYTNGAGITAAAGTRLALHLVIVTSFTWYSFLLGKLKSLPTDISVHSAKGVRIQSRSFNLDPQIYAHLTASALGNFRACCLPWMWQPSLRLPLRNQTLIPRTR